MVFGESPEVNLHNYLRRNFYAGEKVKLLLQDSVTGANMHQCPSLQDARNAMFRELSEVDNGRSHVILASPGDTLYLLLGKIADGFSIEEMVSFWTVAARHIASMYYEKIMEGIG